MTGTLSVLNQTSMKKNRFRNFHRDVLCWAGRDSDLITTSRIGFPNFK